MRSVMLEQLYSGNVGPAHMPPYVTERSKYYSEQVDALEEQLEGLLDERGRKLLRTMLEMRNAEGGTGLAGAFVHGFKMATLIMAEVFMDKESEMLRPEQFWMTNTRPREDVRPADSEKE